MELNLLANKISGVVFIILSLFAMMTAYHAPAETGPGAKIGFGVVGVILLLWGTGLLTSEYFVNVMNIKTAYPEWPETMDNGQIMQKNEEMGTVKPLSKQPAFAEFVSEPVLKK